MDTQSLMTQSTAWQAQNAYANGLAARAEQAAASAPSSMNLVQAKKAAQQFEGFFIGQMMEYMTAGIKADENFGGGSAEETWRSLLNQEYGKEIAKSGKLGVADSVMKTMIKMQEQRESATRKMSSMPDAASAQLEATLPQAAAAAGTLSRAAQLDISA